MDTTHATIISLLPFNLVELKPGLNPNEFIIRKAEGERFGITSIPNNIYYLINPDPLADAKDVRNIKVPVPAIELAQAIITDYANALLGVTIPDAMPGLLAFPGDWKEADRKELATKYIKEIMGIRECQNRWFKNLIDIADDSWVKTRTPFGISELQRDAARMLNYTRDWINPLPSEQIEKCPICKSQINLGALKCVSCGHILNKTEYDKVLAGVK